MAEAPGLVPVTEARDALGRTFERVKHLATFTPGDRIWWIYLRNAVSTWLEANEDAALRAAFDQVKDFPENLINEQARWLDLRQAVEQVLARTEPG